VTDDQHGEGAPRSGGRWDPLPQGDYDDGATAFVKLPEGGIDALLAGDSPLAAPGHGYVPPRIAPTPGTADPADGGWGTPADGQRWPEPNAVPQDQAGGDRFTYNPAATQQWTFDEPAAPSAPGHDVTGQWSIPVAGGDLPDESGEFTTSSLVEQWGGTPPATLPGGAPAPWATEGAGQPWGRPETAPRQGEPEGASLPGHAPQGFAPEGAYAGGTADHVSAPAPHDASTHPGYATDGAEGPERAASGGHGEADFGQDGTLGGHSPAQGPEGPAGGPAARTAAQETRHAPEAVETPDTAAASGTPDPTGSSESNGTAHPSGTRTRAAASADTPGPADAEGAHGAPESGDDPAASQAPHEDPDADAPAATDAPAPADAAPLPPNDDHPLASYVLRVNGADRPVTDAWIGESLLYVLRERLGLAGAKDGCSQGECGACNVQVDGRLVASCLVPAVTASGAEVRTVEGLAVDGQPSDVQRALARCGAVQCGFCVPGIAMTLHDLLEGNPAPTELETRQALCGNLCRCSGYRGVLEAVEEVVAEREAHTAADAETDADEARIPHQAGPGAGGVNPAAFETPGVFDGSQGYEGSQAFDGSQAFGAPGPHDPHDPNMGVHDPHSGPHDQHYGQDGGQA
jgi:aerobic-type carbon monoxide dehydrogenase small subunit (CoxS/CutS family)